MATKSSLSTRRGWTWTLIKCGIAILSFASAGTMGLFWVLKSLLDKLAGWLPAAWARWVFEWMLRHVWFVGPLVGALLGLLVSTVIIVVDAKRGKLSRIR